MYRLGSVGLIIGILFLSLSPPARADAIDGAWCKGLKRLFIDGPHIITPNGTKITGIYDRHGFQYVVPDGKPGAGATVSMAQQHEQLMHMTLRSNPDKTEAWIRCRQQVSSIASDDAYNQLNNHKTL